MSESLKLVEQYAVYPFGVSDNYVSWFKVAKDDEDLLALGCEEGQLVIMATDPNPNQIPKDIDSYPTFAKTFVDPEDKSLRLYVFNEVGNGTE